MSREIVSIERIYNDAERQVNKQKKKSLTNDRDGVGLRGLCRLVGWLKIVDCGHGRGGFGAMKIAFGESAVRINQPRENGLSFLIN